MSCCNIMMSTYNGGKYIREQLDSIISQDHTDWQLLIRDDGSSDNTISIIDEYCVKDNRIRYYQGENLGAALSFMQLIQNVSSADYYAFADQDDIWYTNKISKAISKIDSLDCKEGFPILYVANQNIKLKSTDFPKRRYDINQEPYLNDLMQNIFVAMFSGCTMVLNQALLQTFIEKKAMHKIAEIRMHDLSLYLLAKIVGTVIYDDEPSMDYRRHEQTVTQEERTVFMRRLPRYLKMIKSYFVHKKTNAIKQTAHVLLASFDSCIEEGIKRKLKLIDKYQDNTKSKWFLLKSWDTLKYATGDRFSAYAKVLLNRI